MSEGTPAKTPIDWKQLAMTELARSGSGTIMLCAVATWFVWYGLPMLRQWRTEDMSQITEVHKANLSQIVESYKADQERDAKEKDRLWSKLGVAIQDEGQ